MTLVWCRFLVIFVLIEITSSEQSSESPDEVPLSRSLGFKKFGKTLMDARLNLEYRDTYQAMLRVNRAPIDESEEAGRLHSGRHLDVINDESVHDRRYSAQQRTMVSGRRARSQALRLNKLNSQSLRSHQQHTRRARWPLA